MLRTIFLLILFISNSFFSQTTNIISYNIKYDTKKEGDNNWNSRKVKMINLFNYYEPAILGVQEALLNQIEYIDSSLITFKYIGVGRDDGKKAGEYSAIFYDTTIYDVLKKSTFWLSDTPKEVSVGWDAALQRICTYGLFENLTTKNKLWVFNTHFDHIGKIARENSAKLILTKIQKLNTENLPVILMGDFNAMPDERPIQIIKTQLTDGLEISYKKLYGPPGTFNGFVDKAIVKRIDYFFIHNLHVFSYTHIDDRLDNNKFISDHLPIMITVY